MEGREEPGRPPSGDPATLGDSPTPRDESDQLPEEQPEGAVVDDAAGDVRGGAQTSAGGASHEDRRTGQPSDRDQAEPSGSSGG